MDATPHVFLFGEDAEALAQAHNLEVVSEDYFHTEYRTEQWRRVKDAGTVQLDSDPLPSKGTVGCVVRDPKGNIAAATSTGGMVNKRPGRVGDSAVIGAGTYANNATCAVSGTGNGEEFIRHHVGARLSDLMELGGFDMLSAAEKIVFEELTQGAGGLIAVDREGNIAMPFSSSGMFRAWMKEDAEPHVAIFRDE